MRGIQARDRLAVWTYEQAGEEIPLGDPSVTDAERAAAGRETLAARREALRPANRRRAAAQYAEAGLPDGQDVVRVWRPRDPGELRTRLGGQPLAVWAEDDILHVLWQGQAEEVQLGGGVQPRMWPVEEHALDSTALRASRQVSVYRPPGPGRPLAGCVLADGESTQGFAQRLDPAIAAGAVPPVLVVGVHNAAHSARTWPDLRSQEYLPGVNRRRFDAHMRFVAGEVIGWAAGRFGLVAVPWVSAGFSNGAVWAIAAGQRHPDVFGAVAAFSAGMVPRRISGPARSARVRHYLAAGTLEAGFRRSTRDWADRLGRAGLPCHHEEWIGGHDHIWWEQQLPAALAWLLSAS